MLKLIKKAVKLALYTDDNELYNVTCCTLYCAFIEDFELDPSPEVTFDLIKLAQKVADIYRCELSFDDFNVHKATEVYTKITHMKGNPTFFLKTLIEKFNLV